MLEDAVASHRSWFGRGREQVDLDGVTLFLGEGVAVLAFPDSTGDLETAVHIAGNAGVREIGCWSLLPDEVLGRRLSELGFQDGWQPHWMGLDPRRAVGGPEHEVEETLHCSRELPYASAEHESVLGGDVHHFVARDGATVAGHVVLDVNGAVAGIYDMGVLPGARRRGLGRSLTLAVVSRARAAGCASLTLNATGEGEPLYRTVGFESLGLGMTWWLFPRV